MPSAPGLLPVRALLLPVLLALFAGCADPVPDDVLARSRTTPQWYDDAKFGIFIHWTPASVPAFHSGGPLGPGELEDILLGENGRRELPYVEWYQYSIGVPGSETAAYHAAHYGGAPYADFGPVFAERVSGHWDPEAWAELFAAAGARYVVLVTKHHDGFTLWPSAVPNPYRAAWGMRRDLVGELAAAVRARGMRFGTYYSTGLDWTFKLVTEGDLVRDVLRSAPRGEDYADYAHAQLRELIDRYHPDVLWADIGYPSKGRLGELLASYFAAVPEGAVNDRWAPIDALGRLAEWPGGTWAMRAVVRALIALEPDPLRDYPARIGFKTAEYDSLPGIPPFKWEATRGLGASFGFSSRETAADMLTAEELVALVVDTAAKNGNVLINVGPDSYGQIPAIQQAPLKGLGDWLAVNGEAIYGTRPWRRFGNELGRELRYTQREGALYAIVRGAAEGELVIEAPGVPYGAVEVLGGVVSGTSSDGGLLTLQLAEPMPGPAVVVRFTR